MRTLSLLIVAILAQHAAAAQTSADTAAVNALLVARGFKIERLAAARPPHYAVIAIARHDSLPSLVVARTRRQSAALIGEPLYLAEFLPAQVHWVELPGPVLLLQLVFTDVVEGSVGTVFYRVRGDALLKFFADGPDACAPAALRDLDGDGVPELLVHSEDPSRGDCGEECHIALSERFVVAPGWVQVRRWRRGEFAPAEPDFPVFYRDLSDRYRAVHEWLTTDEPDALRCRGVYWLDDAGLFQRLAERASQLAGYD